MAKRTKKNGKAVAVKGETALATEAAGSWGGEDLSNEDMIIPRILLMQPMSELVTDGIAKIGEFRDSMEKDRVLGNDKKPVEMIIFGSFKTWVEFLDGDFTRVMAVTPENSTLALEEKSEAGTISRDKVLNFYCLLPGDLESGEAFPYVLSCRRTSYRAGKQLATYIRKLSMFKKPSAAKVFTVKSVKTTNDKGTFFVLDVSVGRDTTNKEINECYKWYKSLMAAQIDGRVQTHEPELKTSTQPTEEEEEVSAPVTAPRGAQARF